MIQLTRMLVLATVLMVAHVPLPWRHCHAGMSTTQLAVHVRQYHAAAQTAKLPTGWHWHVFQYDQAGGNRLASPSEESLLDEVDATSPLKELAAACFPQTPCETLPPHPSRTISANSLAIHGQQAYLRYLVLLN